MSNSPNRHFLIGCTKIEFVPIGSHHTRVVHSVDATNNSLYVMHPGCQSILKHRVLQGDSSGSENHIRYSISFRRSNAVPRTDSADQAFRSDKSPNTPPVSAIPASLMVGDSFLARLDEDRLGKNRKTIINLAKGGNKFHDVIQSLRTFKSDSENDKYLIKQIFISVGSNEIRNCKNGIHHLKGELFNLVRSIKHFFPSAKPYMQSLLPLPVTYDNRSHIVENVLDFNKMIYHVCVHERVYMIDIFRTFLFRGYRHHMLFPNNVNDIHPNRRGLGVLARKYIDIIHSRHFGPLNPS